MSPQMMSDPADFHIFETRLHPHRSLTRQNFWMLIGFLALINLITSILFVIIGAWPVAGFLGLDVLLIYVAFRANFRAARAYEELCVTPLDVSVSRISERGARKEWHFNPNWVRLEREEMEEFGTQRLSLVSRGRKLEIGSFLGPDAKSDLANHLNLALAEARRGPRFDTSSQPALS